MSRNGSGVYTLPAGNPVVTGTTIASTWANNTMTDLATALTGSLASDGQTTATGNLKMGNNRITGLANGIASTDAASVAQVTAVTAGLGTMSTQNANAVAVTGGTINGTTVGATTAAAGRFTTLEATGVTTVQAGTAAAPAITTTGDTNTGIFFPAADTIAFSEGGAEAMRIDSSGRVGIGTSSPDTSTLLTVAGAVTITGVNSGHGASRLKLGQDTSAISQIRFYGADNSTAGVLQFTGSSADGSVGTERMRIASDGNVLVGTTSNFASGNVQGIAAQASGNSSLALNRTTDTGAVARFYQAGINVGNISVTGSDTAYNTSSDYRLKDDVKPMQNALTTVSALKPVTYKWKADGSNGQGFIAHELAEVVPDCVTGEKDAVKTVNEMDEEGNVIGTKEVPEYQGIDTSFLVATLTAAIQELKAELDSVKAELATLKA